MTFDANPVLTVLIMQSARAAVLILAILLLRFLVGKRIPPAWRHAIWGLVPLQLLLVVSIPSSISLFNLAKSFELKEPEVKHSVTSGQIPDIPLDIPDTQPDVVPEIVFDNFDATPDEDKPVLSETELAQLALIANALAQMDSDPEIRTASDIRAATVMERSNTERSKPVDDSPGSDFQEQPLMGQASLFNEIPPTNASNSKPDIPISTLLLAVWGVGGLVMIVVFVRQIVRCRRWVARGKPVTSEPVLQLFEESCRRMKIKTWLVVAESAMVRGPFLIGAIRPKLLLPCRMVESASPKQLHAVFLHELAHLKRWDIWTGWLMTLLLIVHWFNPLLWIAIRRMNADREEACDVMAMNTLDRMQQGDYAHSLLDIAQQFVGPTHAPGLVGISETGKFLKRRIDMLKQIGTWKLRWKVLAMGLVLLIAAVTLTDAQEKKPADQPAKTTEELQAEVNRLQAELERLKTSDGSISLNNNRRLFQEIEGFYNGHIGERDVSIALLDKDTATIATAGPNGMVQEKYQPKNSDAAFIACLEISAISVVEDSFMRGSYFGEASFLSENELEIVFHQRNNDNRPLPEELKRLSAQIIRENDGITLVFPKTELWDELRVANVSQDVKNAAELPTLSAEQQELENLRQQLIQKEYSIAQLQVELAKSDKAPPPRLPIIDESTGLVFGNTPDNPPQPVKPQPSKASMVQKDIKNMKQLVLAMHTYHDAYKSLPSASTADKDGKPMHSWRVALLPFLDHVKLYEKIRHNEPWDSEYNRQFHNQMPDVYRSSFLSNENAKNGKTLYAVVAGNRKFNERPSQGGMVGMANALMGGMGEGMMGSVPVEPIFAGVNQWRGFGGITDGTSNTVAIVMRTDPVCWMDPNSDIPFHVAVLGIGTHPDGIGSQNVPELSDKPVTPMALCDGSVQLVSVDLSPDVLRAMLTCNGGESLHFPEECLVDPEPKIVVVYPMRFSASPDSVLTLLKTLLGDEQDVQVTFDQEQSRLILTGRDSDHRKVRMFLDVVNSFQKPDEPQRRLMVYRLHNKDAAKMAETFKALLPNANFTAEPETDSLIISALPEEVEKIRNAIQQIDKTPEAETDEDVVSVAVYTLSLMDAHTALPVLQTMLRDRPDVRLQVDARSNSVIVQGRKADHEKAREVIQQIDKAPETPKAETDEAPSLVVYTLSSIDTETALPVLQTALKDRPDVKLQVDARTNSVIVQGRRADHEKAREVITTLDKTPPAVNPGTTSTLPWYGPTPPDPVAGKYLATDEDGQQFGFELTRIEDISGPDGWSEKVPRYRIVMYGDGFKEDKGRMIGTATLNGNKIDVEWELSHDGKRYSVLTQERQSGRFLQDGDTMLLLLSSGGSDTEGTVATKVKEEKPPEPLPQTR